MLKKGEAFVSGGGEAGRDGLDGKGSQEGGADKVDVFPGAAFERGEVLFIWPCKEKDEEGDAANRAAGVL